MGKKKSKTQKFKKNKKRKARRINVDKVVNPLILVEKGGKIMFKTLEEKVKNYFYHHYGKYAIEYQIEGDKIKVISNIGLYRYVPNTKSNIKKLDEAIIKNKVTIAEKIDDYERTNESRAKMLLFNISMILFSGLSIVFAFFSGSYLLFLLSVISFSICTFAASTSGLTYFILVSEIRNLKRATGYKQELEIEMPKLNTKNIKKKLKLIKGQ
ncbi:MAG: hypothetical protein IJS56_01110 [Bacilli bacterium]|nr:hypothetical protein [Bacilli bacterium]